MPDRFLDQFDLVLIINLARRGDRRREMLAQLRSIGHEPGGHIQWFPAVEPAEAAGFRSIGARGCFLSHMGCLEKALMLGAGNVLILEDDADFIDGYAASQRLVCAGLKAHYWDMFYGGGAVEGDGDAVLPVAPGVSRLGTNASIYMAHCVAVHGRRLQELRDYLAAMLIRAPGAPDGGPMDVDGAYAWFQQQRATTVLLATPPLAYQRASASDITKSKLDRTPGLRHLLKLARLVKRRIKAFQ